MKRFIRHFLFILEKMISTKGPYLLECAIKENEDIVPMTLPGKSVDEMQLELNY